MEFKVINGGSNAYLSCLSEFKDGLPFGVINKVKTDVGGTYVAANCDSNYIIVCPFRDLVDSIFNDKNNKYEIFKMYGGSKKMDFNYYMQRNKVYKFAVTYDSLPKLMGWIGDVSSYKVVVDEYHLVLEDMNFRREAIAGLISNITKFKHYSFLSATPIDFEYEIEFLKNLPHYKVSWDNLIKITPIRYKCSSVIAGLTKLIELFLEKGIQMPDINGEIGEVKQLFVFLNSVTSIKQICDTLELEQSMVKICCAERIRNKKVLGEYAIESAGDNEWRKINFFTKKCFQGCNMFAKDALIIVASDCHRTQTLVDVATTLEQIAGRLRVNSEYQNRFRNSLVHLYSTSKAMESDEEFSEKMEKRELRAKHMLSIQNKITSEELQTLIEGIKEDDFLTEEDGKIIYSELVKQNLQYKHDLRKCYKDGFTIRDAYAKSSKFETTNQNYWTNFDVEMKKATIVSYQTLLKDYLANPSDEYLKDYPEFSGFKKYLKVSEMNSLNWNKEKMIKMVEDRKQMDKVYREVFIQGFISNADLKKRFAEAFKKFGINLTPKASLIENCNIYDVKSCKRTVDGKRYNGYELNNLKICCI